MGRTYSFPFFCADRGTYLLSLVEGGVFRPASMVQGGKFCSRTHQRSGYKIVIWADGNNYSRVSDKGRKQGRSLRCSLGLCRVRIS